MSGLLNFFRRTDSIGVTVPPMDGALKPNTALQDADLVCTAMRPDNLVFDGEDILFSSGRELMRVSIAKRAKPRKLDDFSSEISALASNEKGLIAVALDNGDLRFTGTLATGKPPTPNTPIFITAMAFHPDGSLYLCSGSATNPSSEWKRDLLERNASGAIWKYSAETGGLEQLDTGLCYPNGICATSDGSALLVSESWAHQLSVLPLSSEHSASRVVLEDLPGYPSRVVRGRDGYWLTMFAPRGQLMEFVLKEDEYRSRMMATIDPKYWVCPALHSGDDFLEPLQLGAIRIMGQIKPWAPTRSYGLLVRLDAQFQPCASAHSRADGDRHGVTSCLESDGRLFICSKGGNAIVTMAPGDMREAG